MFNRNKLKYQVDEHFFDNWTAPMAYVLGFTYADGNIYKTSLSWDVQIRDKNILEKIKRALRATYPIGLQRKVSFRLRISNQVIIQGAIRRGLLPKKNIRNCLPDIPEELSRHFIRGYLDGDGWISLRRKQNELNIGFSNGNREFLETVNRLLVKQVKISGRPVRERIKITLKRVKSITYMLEYYSSTAFKIAAWLYENLDEKDLFLERKYKKFLRAKKLYAFLQSGTKKTRLIQRRLKRPIKDLLRNLYLEENMEGPEIAKQLGVHFSSVYRWLHKEQIPIRGAALL